MKILPDLVADKLEQADGTTREALLRIPLERQGLPGLRLQPGMEPDQNTIPMTMPSLLILTVGTGTTGRHSNLAQGLVNTLCQLRPRLFSWGRSPTCRFRESPTPSQSNQFYCHAAFLHSIFWRPSEKAATGRSEICLTLRKPKHKKSNMSNQDDAISHTKTPAPDPLVSGVHSRGALPHLKCEGASYFVTFRLEGTLPREVLVRLKQERDALIHQAIAQNRPLTWQEQKDLFNWYSAKVDAYLDAGSGNCWLRQPEIARLVSQALMHFDQQRYVLRAWVVMPNHVHAVVRPEPPHTLSQILKSWKGFTAVKANRLLGREGKAFWQNESYDHCCRDDEDLAGCCAYTAMNPVNAGLCESPEAWPWSSACVTQVVGQVSDLTVPGVSDSPDTRGAKTKLRAFGEGRNRQAGGLPHDP